MVSYSTNALTFASLIFLILVYLYSSVLSYTQIILISLSCILFATIVPLVYIFIFVSEERKIHHLPIDYDISDRKYRVKPFFVCIMSYGIGTLVLFFLNAPILVKGLMFCYFINGFVVMLITLFWKISVHTSGITGPLTVLIYKLGVFYLPLYLIVVPVALARIRLKEHSPLQVTAGALLIILTTWLQLVYIIIPYF